MFQGITYLDRAAILDPISHLLPVRVELPPMPSKQPVVPAMSETAGNEENIPHLEHQEAAPSRENS